MKKRLAAWLRAIADRLDPRTTGAPIVPPAVATAPPAGRPPACGRCAALYRIPPTLIAAGGVLCTYCGRPCVANTLPDPLRVLPVAQPTMTTRGGVR